MVNPSLLTVRVNLAHRGSCSELGTLDNSGLEIPFVVLLSPSTFRVSGLSLRSPIYRTSGLEGPACIRDVHE